MRFRRIQNMFHFEDIAYGTLARTAQAPIIVREGMEATLTMPLDFTQILFPLLSGVRGGVTSVGQGTPPGTDGWQWTFTPSANADPGIDTYTLEFVESDFSNEAELEAPYTFCTGFSITGGVENLPELSVDLVGRQVVESTKTPSLSVPSLVYAPNLKWVVTADDTWAAMVGATPTQVLGQVYGFKWQLSDFVFPQYYLDGRIDFTTYHFRRRVVDLSMDIAHDPAGTGRVQIEEAKKTAGAVRYIGLKLVGPAIGAKNHEIHLRGAFTHADDSLQERGNDRDGNLVTTWHLQSIYDATTTKDFEVVINNTTQTFP